MFAQKLRKIVSSIFMVLFLCGVIGAVTALPGKVYAAAAPSAIGVVDYGLLLNEHPDTQKAYETIRTEKEQAKREFDAKAANLSDQEKKDLDLKLTQRVVQKQQEVLGVIINKVNAAVKAVADAKGLTMVVNINAVVFGGQNITSDVMKQILGK
jgi:outer membrane protein